LTPSTVGEGQPEGGHYNFAEDPEVRSDLVFDDNMNVIAIRWQGGGLQRPLVTMTTEEVSGRPPAPPTWAQNQIDALASARARTTEVAHSPVMRAMLQSPAFGLAYDIADGAAGLYQATLEGLSMRGPGGRPLGTGESMVRIVGVAANIGMLGAGMVGREAAAAAQRGPMATLELAERIAAAGEVSPWRRTVALLETHEGPTLVGAGASDLSVAQKALARELGLTVVPDFVGIHAEGTVINGAGQMGLTPRIGVTTNHVCTGICTPMIRGLGAPQGAWVNGRWFGFFTMTPHPF